MTDNMNNKANNVNKDEEDVVKLELDNGVKIVNCTPHAITILSPSLEVLYNIPSACSARVAEAKTKEEPIGDIPVTSIEYGEVTGMPELDGDEIVVVSRITAMALRGTEAVVFFPYGEERDDAGRIVGVHGLGRFAS